jgi:hypothetical protein
MVGALSQCEKERPRMQREESLQFMASCFAKVKSAQQAISQDLAGCKYSQENKKYASVVKTWILMNPRNKREEIFHDYKETLKSEGIQVAELLSANDEPLPTPDEKLLDNLINDKNQIHDLLNKFYLDIFAGKRDALRPIISPKVSDKRIEQMIKKYQVENKEYSEIYSVEVVSIDPKSVANNRVSVHVVYCIVAVKKGSAVVAKRESDIELLVSDGKWMLWFQD